MFLGLSGPLTTAVTCNTLKHIHLTWFCNLIVSHCVPCLAAILDDQSACGRGERLALALARENINSLMEGPAHARVEVDIFELQRDSQYETTDTSEYAFTHLHIQGVYSWRSL